MNRPKLALLCAIAIVTTLLMPTTHTTAATPFAADAFKSVWSRTDALAGQSGVNRGYYWGPQPGVSISEDYAEGVNGKRLVQYFDKSRMEINNPHADKSSKFYVTNGLLTVELITGRMQVGDNKYVARYPAYINLASDADDPAAPTYASFRDLLHSTDSHVGRSVTSNISRSGYPAEDRSKTSDRGAIIAYYEPITKHNIPKVFWDFLNQSGPVMNGGKRVIARLNDPWFYATGYPIAEAYWAKVKIAGQPNTDVLIQPYQRRVLTYVPSAPAAYRVQMGNIGQHYYDWRYNNAGKPSFDAATCKPAPSGVLGEAWSAQHAMSDALHCPILAATDAVVSAQTYQNGAVIKITEQYPAYSHFRAFFLFTDGSAQQASDADVAGGIVRVPARLGSALGPETIGLGWYQQFAAGYAVSVSAPVQKVYVFYDATGTGYCCVSLWQAYNNIYLDPVHTYDPNGCRNSYPPTRGEGGKVWADHPLDQAALNCPYNPATDAQILHERFQGGEMIETVQYFRGQSEKRGIFVLYDDGGAAFFEDNYVDGSDPGGHEIPPSPDLYAPKYGFGKLWREHSDVRERLGWAAAPEASSTDSFQEFDYGMIILTGPPDRKAYVIYDTSRIGGFVSVDRWRVYDDTSA